MSAPADRHQSLLRQPLRPSRREAAAERVLHDVRGHGADDRARLVRRRVPARSVRGHRRDEPLHAARRRRRSGAAASESMRYGAYAMEVLINEMIKAGGRRERFEAKVLGRRRAGRDDDDQHRRPQRGFRAATSRSNASASRRKTCRACTRARSRSWRPRARGGEEAAAAGAGRHRARSRARPRGRSRPRRTAASAGRAVRGQASGPAAAGAPAHRAVRRAQRAPAGGVRAANLSRKQEA